MNTLKKTLSLAAVIAVFALSACGGGGSGGGSGNQGNNSAGWNATPDWTPHGAGGSGSTGNASQPAPGDNTATVSVDNTMGGVNMLKASIKVCVPGSQNTPQCVTLDNMLVDTGSTGVRIAARAIPTLAPLLLTQVGAVDDNSGSAPIVECMPFASGYMWGSVKRADITIGSKTASNLPIQVYSDGMFTTPDDCSNYGADIGGSGSARINGIIGIDNFTSDSLDAVTTAIPGNYYYCPSQNACNSTRMLASKEVRNPVAAFATDNNGTVIRLPAVPAGGQATATGQLVFGVGTQQNNTLPTTATVLAIDKYGSFTTQYQGQVFTRSVIDSGTNFYAFPDSTIPTDANDWYTPTGTLNLSATMESTNGTGKPVEMPFSIANAASLRSTGYYAFNNMGAYFSYRKKNSMFLWGLPFFYGRDIYTVIGNARIGNQTGPFVAF
ncbi:DUF3443 domain-containing protein [Paraburkholderia rhynchosiae]|uniref:DUF3443 domain-containing protein n=1 Tax=Paraburkholderia rhynchosiae TaxID=487049 RepID=A0A2N7WY52_9BURK|nr:DUF3443 domain-containing protein [Paraburkholderia rhynchosiae]PMS34165.1 hypothetical protein C0Z16_00955 [Paraburkholderia rhynchosiae]CAB3637342.1 hypothetical protein LMG27174_00187 [Paraburkholderia rhynchosiae]